MLYDTWRSGQISATISTFHWYGASTYQGTGNSSIDSVIMSPVRQIDSFCPLPMLLPVLGCWSTNTSLSSSQEVLEPRLVLRLSRVIPLAWLMRFTYYRCLRKHLKCHFLQIELNNWLLHMLQESSKVSLITSSVEQLIYLFLARCCLLSILPLTLQRHPCPLGSQKYSFTLETYTNGTPAPSVVTKEVDMAVSAPFFIG